MNLLVVSDDHSERSMISELLKSMSPHIHPMPLPVDGVSPDILASPGTDAVFLDIEGSSIRDLELIGRIQKANLPIVAITEQEQFAMTAFEAGFTDCLQKPLDLERLEIAVSRITRRQSPAESPFLILGDGLNFWPVKMEEISVVEGDAGYSTVHFSGTRQSICLSRSLNDLELALKSPDLIRANRNAIVNLNHVRVLKRLLGGRLLAEMESGPAVEFSRRQAQIFRKTFL